MTTAMTEALKTAGVALPPQNQRLWQVLHDKGRSMTSKELAAASKISYANVATLCLDMVHRGIMERAFEVRRGSAREISVWKAVGTHFELPPVKKEFKKKSKVEERRALLAQRAEATAVRTGIVSQLNAVKSTPVAEPKAYEPLPIAMPPQLTPEMIEAVRTHESTAMADREQWHARLGWLMSAYNVMVACRAK